VGLFASKKKSKNANKKPATIKKVVAAAPPKVVPEAVPKVVPAEAVSEAVPEAVSEAEAEAEALAAAAPETEEILADADAEANAEGDFGEELEEIGKLIREGQTRDLYNTGVPTAYVPQTRRGFADFISTTFTPFQLPVGPITIPEGDKYYPYQKFVRDYMRSDSPYRGVLVYHGLGSGKTCTAIAAAEALYATSNKKIIVMAPFSLKKNFLKEVSFCGFRHFQLNNFWISMDHTKKPTVRLFAQQVLGISDAFLSSAKEVWIPDFRRPQSESNYSKLSDTQRTDIRKQILSVVDWHPTKNPSGRIKFIAYNGYSAKKLMQLACDPSAKKFFDDAVIVVDEIHNLIRLIQGKIQPYLSDVGPGGKKLRRTVLVEAITQDRWKPTLCKPGSKPPFTPGEKGDDYTKLYTRGYLFYRLLLDARNSKIVGLSGTPLINFPEELGILANVLHGYTTTAEGLIEQAGKAVQDRAERVGHEHPYIDYVKAIQSVKGGGTIVLFSLLPPGIIKVSDDKGVARIPDDEPKMTFEQIMASIRKAYSEAGIPFSAAPQPKMHEILPPFGDNFKAAFMKNEQLVNKGVLITRLTGLISFYKGSSLELMPAVVSDEVVRVPFSPYAQKAYSFKRSTEVKSEMEAAGQQTVDAVFAKVYELGDSVSANNYKMGSRQACNFAFPADVTRPSPTAKDKTEEAAAGLISAEVVALAAEEDKGADEFVELEEEEEDRAEALKAAEEDEEAMSNVGEEEVAPPPPSAKVPVTAGEETDELIRQYYEERGEEVPEEYRGLGAKDNAARDAEMERMMAAPRVPQEGDEELPPRPHGKTAKAAVAAAPKAKTAKAPKEPGVSATEIRFYPRLENKYKFFSNYAATPTKIGDQIYPTIEHYYQSKKFERSDPEWRKLIIAAATPADARKMGSSKDHPINPGFIEERIRIMKYALEMKFTKSYKLRQLLLSTGTKQLIDASPVDKFWGEGEDKTGENNLGKILMEVREGLQGVAGMPPLEGEEQGGGGKTLAELRAAKAASVAVAPPRAPPPRAPAAPAEDCRVGTLPGEKYKAACARARNCLKTIAKSKMLLSGQDGLANYSAKYATMLENIAAAPGSSLVYSQFLDMEGVGIFRVAMEVNDYVNITPVIIGGKISFSPEAEASIRLGPGKQARYMTFSGAEDQEIRRTALDIFNAKFSELPGAINQVLSESGYTDEKLGNSTGQLCRVFCITSAGAEGLSLRNVRAVHIMEPYWNDVRLKQVKGRAIRIGSHTDLPKDQQNVRIYTYISCFSEKAQRDRASDNRIDETLVLHDSVDAKKALEYGLPIKEGMTNYVLTTDEMIYAISEKKRKVIEGLECIMKAAAVDCELNYNQNKDGSFQCLSLKGKVGDFVYHPVLENDLHESGGKFDDAAICTGVKPGAAPQKKAREFYQDIAVVSGGPKEKFRLREMLGPDGSVTGYEVFETDKADPKKKIPDIKRGTVGVRSVKGVSQPGPPVKIEPAV
jgi:ribA/ribD-fused uncharacterized protein